MVIKQMKNFNMQKLNDEAAEVEQIKPKVPKEIYVIAQEIKIVQSLASNDVNKRNRQMRTLRKWLKLRAQSSFPFTEDDFMRIWKGLYYNMWMSDKPLVQEELAEQIAKLLECFVGNPIVAIKFFGAFLKTMHVEWFGIDQWRIDKFMMLVRRILRYTFLVLKSSGWSMDVIEHLNGYLEETILAEQVIAVGLIMHMFDIYFEELAKVSDGNIDAEIVGQFIQPFIMYLGKQKDTKLVSHCQRRIFHHLLYQSSMGREYFEKYNAWRDMGFPATIDDLERNEDVEIDVDDNDDIADADVADADVIDVDDDGGDNDDDDDIKKIKQLDPRAGKVDVFMPELPLDATTVIDGLKTLLYNYELNTKRRKMLKKLLDAFEIYKAGRFPLGIKRMPRFKSKSETPLIMDKVEQLEKMENDEFSTNRKLKQLNKRNRRKLLNSLNFENADEHNIDQIIEDELPKYNMVNGRKRKAKYAFMNNWIEEELTEEDIAPKKLIKLLKANSKIKTKTNNKNKKLQLKKKNKKLQNAHKNDNETTTTEAITTEAITTEATTTTITTAAATTTKAITPLASVVEEASSKSAWNEPLADGEYEYFVPTRKLQIKSANSKLVRNPLSKTNDSASSNLPKLLTSLASSATSLLQRSDSNISLPNSTEKRVKIMLKNNTTQNPQEYIKQIRSSPNIPYDAQRLPKKSLLKPNSMPSPINPFYKKKIGLNFMNETM